MRHRRSWIGAACLGLWGFSATAPAAAPDAATSARDAKALAGTIDRLLAEKWAEAKLAPAPPADDATFLRRLSLDLIGKIPLAGDAQHFLKDADPEKRANLVNAYLDGGPYTKYSTEIYRSLILPEADTDPNARFIAPAFESWLGKKVDQNAGYDQIVREVLTTELKRGKGNPFNTKGDPTPLAFYVAKGGKPENLAAGTARVFLGIRLECAQCHNHPFARWKREEFWGLASFFAGVGKQGEGDNFNTIKETPNRHELPIPGTEKIVKASYLDGSKPKFTARSEGRALLADWVTADDNPYFARAAVNRVWARFFGNGLVEPVDDMGADNPPSHPELLDELADQFRTHGYDLKFLIRALTMSRAYGLSSAVGRGESAPPLFAAMPVRGLAPGQLYDSLAQATGLKEAAPNRFGLGGDNGKTQFLEQFANRDEKPTESQMSILQALTLMNGSIVSGATSLQSGDTIAAITASDNQNLRTTADRIEQIYFATLTRKPRPEELSMLLAFVDGAGPGADKANVALADVFWALLNSPEFRLNH